MKRISPVRRGTAALVAAVAGLAGAVAAGTPTADAAPTTVAARAASRTTLTFEVPDCDGCKLQVMQARWSKSSEYGMKVWSSKEKAVTDGSVTFRILTRHTKGLSMTVDAPWEGHTGYVTTLAFRYGGEKPGTEIGFRDARSKSKGSACWAGTDADAVTIPLTVRKVWVEGLRHRVRGSIAYASVTQEWMPPMRAVWKGVMGSQDVNVCGKQPS